MHFVKMQGLGNDYIYVLSQECEHMSEEEIASLARRMSRRHFGIGADGLVLIAPGQDGTDFRMIMYNADGSKGKMCGNAARCIGKYVYERGLTDKQDLTIDTLAGTRGIHLDVSGRKALRVTVDMGAPSFLPEDIPMKDYGSMTGGPVDVGGRKWLLHPVSMGNPHCVMFLEEGEDVHDLAVHKYGPLFEHLPCFPDGVNAEFIQVESRDHIYMRVWERGSGETMACGTGACAAVAASAMCDRTGREVTVTLPGGDLKVFYREDGHIMQTGDASFAFEGEWTE